MQITYLTFLKMADEGESELLEFKSSLRWDYQQGCINKALENVVVKTVAAFANANGGTLLIGINDDFKTLGLENDYASLGADKDKFELHLRSILASQISTSFVASLEKTQFPVINDVEISQVDVLPSPQPIFLSVADKNGVKSEKIYVRNGNSSHELSMSEFDQYRKGRFD
jgi:predicted HTH transcriptional regulator